MSGKTETSISKNTHLGGQWEGLGPIRTGSASWGPRVLKRTQVLQESRIPDLVGKAPRSGFSIFLSPTTEASTGETGFYKLGLEDK